MLPLVLAAAGAAQPVSITLPGDKVFPESVSIAADGTAYVGSVSGGVLRVSLASGKVEQWIKPAAFGSGRVFGVLVDPVNKLLWTCNNDLGFLGVGPVAGADKGTFLKGFDLRTGAGKVSIKLAGARPFCNDMAVAKDGTLYVAETNQSHILRWKPGADALEDWFFDPVLTSPQGGLDGIAFGSDGNLYLNNFRSHVLARVEVKPDGTPGKATALKTSRPFKVPDGLRPLGGMRFAQAESSGKIALVTVSGDTAQVETLVEGLSSPTSVDIHDGTLWYVQGELSHLIDPQLRDKAPPLPFQLAPVSLHQNH